MKLPAAAMQTYRKFAKEMYAELAKADVRAFNAAAKTMKCLQLANGAVYTDPDATVWEETHTAKLEALEEIVEESLRGAALWDEVKDKLKQSAYGLSGGQQQRLCIARTIATRPDVILMDEPCSALDPIATSRIEDLMMELRSEYTIIIVTHNMQQAARVSDRTAFFTARPDETTGNRTGLLVEFALTSRIFANPSDKRTEDYISGRFG